MPKLSPGYVVYIDEAGDPGVRDKQNVLDWTQWFSLGAVVVSVERDKDAADWVRDMREAVRSRQRKDLHYRDLSLPNRRRVCRMLATKHVRLFAVASHKANIRTRRNAILGSHGADDFYNFCLRWLLERVSAWCAARSLRDHGEILPLKIVFSERGGHNYQQLLAYLRKLDAQAITGSSVLKARTVVPGMISPDRCEVRPHDTVAGLQLADIVASAIFQAANTALAKHDLSPARLLKPRLAKERGQRSCAGFGLSLLPLPSQGQHLIPPADKAIFRYYGFNLPDVDGPRPSSR